MALSNINIKLIVFDLDGTLVSSHETIYKATVHSLNLLNIENKITQETFNKKIGMHFVDIFEEYDMNVPDFEKFIQIYKSIYFDYIESSHLYEGVEECIDKLDEFGVKKALLTTKSQEQAEMILKHFNIYHKFDYIMGRRPGFMHKPSSQPLLFICNEMNIKPDKTLIVGDSELDIICGKNANTHTCAVTYGYGELEELVKFNPDFIINEIYGVINVISGTN